MRRLSAIFVVVVEDVGGGDDDDEDDEENEDWILDIFNLNSQLQNLKF